MKKVKNPVAFTSWMPQEEMLDIKKSFKGLSVGVPKESSFQENRVGLSPDAVALLVSNGHLVLVEQGAGKNAHFSDENYAESGAKIVQEKEQVFQADIILKIEPPTLKELPLLHKGQTIISALQLTSLEENYLRALMQKEVNALAYEFIEDENGVLSLIRSISEIAGNTAILIAAEYLSNANNGKGLMLGGVSGILPTEIVILGAGTVGEYATRTAVSLGASVHVFDNSIAKLRRLQEIVPHRISTSVLQPKSLLKALKRADVVIGALRAKAGRTPCVVTEEMVQQMKAGAVVVDVSIDQGGCFETAEMTNHKNPTFTKYDVIHYCVPNISSRVSRTASIAISNVLSSIILDLGDFGGIENLIRKDAGIRAGVYILKGKLTNEILSKQFNIPYQNLNLVL